MIVSLRALIQPPGLTFWFYISFQAKTLGFSGFVESQVRLCVCEPSLIM